MSGIAVKRDPALWARSKRRACTKHGLCAHSARKMQMATRLYKEAGGTYVGTKTDNRLARWTSERWRTASGLPSEGRRRYLPDAAWARLTPSQVRRTDAAKRRGTARGQQYVRQPSDVARVAAAVRRRSASHHTGYPWLSYAEAHAHEAEAAREGVSEVARGPGGFMRLYERHGQAALRALPHGSSSTWGRRRDNFVKRHMAQYAAHPTRRRWLALLMWAYRPPGRPPPVSLGGGGS